MYGLSQRRHLADYRNCVSEAVLGRTWRRRIAWTVTDAGYGMTKTGRVKHQLLRLFHFIVCVHRACWIVRGDIMRLRQTKWQSFNVTQLTITYAFTTLSSWRLGPHCVFFICETIEKTASVASIRRDSTTKTNRM